MNTLNTILIHLLDVAVITPVPVHHLVHPLFEPLYNRKALTYSIDDLQTTLLHASRKQFLTFSISASETDDDDRRVIQPTEEMIRRSLENKERSITYELTVNGGSIWENHVRPLWHMRINTFLYREYLVLEAVSRDRIQRYAMLCNALSEPLLLERITWEQIKPWPVTYWKYLPMAYIATIPYDKSRQRALYNECQNSLINEWGLFPHQWHPWESRTMT